MTPAVGERRARVGLLLGCVQRVVFGDVNVATARVLAAEGCEVVAPAQECCGALHLHAGRAAEGHRRAEELARAFGDVDAIVVNAAGCGSHLKDAELPVRVVDVNEFLAELGPRAPRQELPLKVAYQDACHLGHAQGIRDAPRSVLRSIPGLELVEPAEQPICCGSAGIYNLTQPAAASELGERKAANVAATGAEAYASANPAASSRSPPTSARPSTRCRPCIRSSWSTPRSAASPATRCSAQLGAELVDAAGDLVADLADPLERLPHRDRARPSSRSACRRRPGTRRRRPR